MDESSLNPHLVQIKCFVAMRDRRKNDARTDRGIKHKTPLLLMFEIIKANCPNNKRVRSLSPLNTIRNYS